MSESLNNHKKYENKVLSGVIEKTGVEELNGLEVSVSIGGMEIFGAPAGAGTSDLLNFGVSFSYPVLF